MAMTMTRTRTATHSARIQTGADRISVGIYSHSCCYRYLRRVRCGQYQNSNINIYAAIMQIKFKSKPRCRCRSGSLVRAFVHLTMTKWRWHLHNAAVQAVKQRLLQCRERQRRQQQRVSNLIVLITRLVNRLNCS